MQTQPAVETTAQTELFEHLAVAIRYIDAEGVAVPFLVPGFTDAGPFAELGITYYGFSPIRFPSTPRVAFADLYHADDERIPVDGFLRGAACASPRGVVVVHRELNAHALASVPAKLLKAITAIVRRS